MARQEIAAPDGPETHLSRKRVPVAKSTILSSGPINGGDTLTVELIQPDRMPVAVRIVWPSAATITTPAHYLEVRLPPNRGGIDYKESHAREAEEVRR